VSTAAGAGPSVAESVRLSVVVASYNSRRTIERCLRSLEEQRECGPIEVIVVDSSTDGTADLVAREFPGVRLLPQEKRHFPGDARNLGVALSRGDVVAFTDSDCVVEPGWARLVLDAHARFERPVIGGAVENGNPESAVGWAYYFAEFSAWMPCGEVREMRDIPTTCLTLKRWVFDRYGPFLEGTYCSDSAFNWKVARNGLAPLFLPSLRVGHVNPTGLRELVRRKLFHGACFARVRVAEEGFSDARRLAHALTTPVLPILLFARTLRRVRRQGRHRLRFALTAPLVLLAQAAWSAGELRGYLSPNGRAHS
jgi:glycosyltransferase involved in cell wall biosynthesis